MASEHLGVWVDKRLNQIRERPEMWGGAEAVELQLLLLAEAAMTLRRPSELRDDRSVLEFYLNSLPLNREGIDGVPRARTYQWQQGRTRAEIVMEFNRFIGELLEPRFRAVASVAQPDSPFATGDMLRDQKLQIRSIDLDKKSAQLRLQGARVPFRCGLDMIGSELQVLGGEILADIEIKVVRQTFVQAALTNVRSTK
ncbi:MAG: hypothetical protein Q8L14_09295 [Myxococcales bacterium]|nr:hypothetical protein [Myxococcales bacterium]